MAKVITLISQQTPEMASFGKVASGTSASIGAGTPTFGVDAAAASPWLGTVAVGSTGNGTTSQRFTGIAKGVSNETASVTGTVELWEPFPGVVYTGFATTANTANTDALILALKGQRVTFSLSAGDWTVNTGATDAKANCVVLLGTGNSTLSTVNFVYAPHGTYLDFAISA